MAQHFATVQLGYRTEQDATLALRRQVPLQRFTPLDRLIVARTQPWDGISGDLQVTADPARSGLGRFAAVREQSLASRLMTLQTMGLARPDGPHQWQVRRDLETALKAMQRAADNQKTLAAHGALLSDPRLQLSAPNWRDVTSLEGRVLSHGEEDDGRRYLMLERTDGRVYYLRYTPELDKACRIGGAVSLSRIWGTSKRCSGIETISGLWPGGWLRTTLILPMMSVGAGGSGGITKSSAKRYMTSATRKPDIESGV